MNEKQLEAIRLIEEQQQELPEWSPARMAGEQLKGIASMDPEAAELLAEDLRVKGKGIVDAEKQIKKRADEYEKERHATVKGSGAVCVQPWVAEDILREFYGLPPRTWGPGKEQGPEGANSTAFGAPPPLDRGGSGKQPKPGAGKVIDLTDFF